MNIKSIAIAASIILAASTSASHAHTGVFVAGAIVGAAVVGAASGHSNSHHHYSNNSNEHHGHAHDHHLHYIQRDPAYNKDMSGYPRPVYQKSHHHHMHNRYPHSY